MDDSEVTRQAIGIAISSWSQLDQHVTTLSKKSISDVQILQAYIQLCPFVGSDSPAYQSALLALGRLASENKNKEGPCVISQMRPLPNERTTRAAMRIAISAWSQLLVQCETLDDRAVMQKYIQQCPYIEDTHNSTAALAVLHALGVGDAANNTTSSTNAPPLLGKMESDSDDSDAEDHSKKAKRKGKNQQNQKSILRPILLMARSLFLDLPMLLLFATYLALLWVHRVDQLYLKPTIDAAVWTDRRAENEITYYNRECDGRDLTTNDADDLIIPHNATAKQAYEHQLLHGFSMFQGVLTASVMQDLRNYVISRNRKLSAPESIFVIENDNRYSFGLGTEVSCVARAVEQLATHDKLKPALEKILGPNPALIEMTAITSSFGAVNQYWHDDVVAQASVMKYGRTFGPSYSIFVQLQNTTKAMGATDTCPGTHKCATGEIEKVCEREGFPAVDSSSGYWKAGDALLMNMNSYHRGTAHTDPNAPDRVMLILTFVPQPQSRAESRQMSQGITFSLRWDMWGHTLWDLAKARTRMTQPWATLRALGLYKPKDAAWGVDYVSSAIMRMANEDNGFRRDELETFLELGGFHWLPTFLHGQVKEKESWHEFLKDTLERCLELVAYINAFVVGLYIVSVLVIYSVSPQQFGVRGVGSSLFRSAILYGLAYWIWHAANNHVDNTGWAKDIRAGRRYKSAFDIEKALPVQPSLSHFPSTLPHRKDVLIETRYASRQFHMYNDFVNNHPGNRFFQSLVETYAYASSLVQSNFFQRGIAKYIVSAVSDTQGRFLLQNGNQWLWLSDDKAISFAMAELVVEFNPILKGIRKEIRFKESDYKYGVLRGTAIARTSLQRLKSLTTRLLGDTPLGTAIYIPSPKEAKERASVRAPAFSAVRQKQSLAKTTRPLVDHQRRSRFVDISGVPTEPRFGAWLKSGDMVEGTEFLEDNSAHWYRGRIHHVTAEGAFYVAYDDQSHSIIGTSDLIRPYQPYYVGEEVELFMGDDDLVEIGTIVKDNHDDTFDMFLDTAGEMKLGVPTGDMRRPRLDKIDSGKTETSNKYAP